jgi:hypothetical protein
MVNEKLLNKINKTFENHIFSIQSDFLRSEENMIVDFKLNIAGTTNLFSVGIEYEYILVDIQLPFELNGNGTKDQVFTLLHSGLGNKYNYDGSPIFTTLSYTIAEYVKDVLSWFGINNRVKINKITLITQ